MVPISGPILIIVNYFMKRSMFLFKNERKNYSHYKIFLGENGPKDIPSGY